MINIYRTDNRIISEIDQFDTGAWVKLTAPSLEECAEISDRFHMDIADVRAALDDEESSRINLEDEYTLILVDIPSAEMRNNRHSYTTIPLGILIAEDVVITVCAEETAVLRSFVEQRVRDFSTKKQMRFTYQILYNACMVYQSLLRSIDRKRTEIEERIDQNTEDVDLIDLHELESNLVYFATSLRANGVVLDRLTRYGRLRQYSEDQELLEDVIIENRQAIEMTQIYRDIINGTRELMSTVINNRLNNVMKYLAAITIVMSIPTIISGLWGMNVGGKWMPFSSTPHGFAIICVITLLLCIVVMLWLRKKKML
ncbi:magnesium transporter CorA family protein [Roseburia sp. AM51-8]|uniref:Magnesium transporter CorA family protein n=1 Tax=Roseburia lenta TaxID=2763061 RepID=A0ABR7GF17_9FIRM|nr:MULTISPECIES: magnesium transporter CorA family protein [Roseburia]MBC5686038.1 magnesium transporter CorA family protein [Roseburia lenta]MDY3873314.1 magnesium transporter CorA family protein [Roseburia lenta]RHO33153.1 magnesium transporter CorA family protein [Roseburia sp. AM16-25]RHQ01320.1 magnesium transporter CorA family protein [Roseburia sp. AM51-8]